MPPELAELGITALPEIFKTIAGISQTAKANAINPVRPTYKVPQAINEAVNTARAQYYNPRLPQEDYISGRIGSSAATSIRAATQAGRTPAEILAAAAGAEDNQNEALTNLALQAAKEHNLNSNMLEGQLDNQGVWQDKADDYNQRQPYQETVNAKSALTDAGNTNINNGLQGISNIASNDSLTALLKKLTSNQSPITGMTPTKVGQTGNDPDNIPSYAGIKSLYSQIPAINPLNNPF